MNVDHYTITREAVAKNYSHLTDKHIYDPMVYSKKIWIRQVSNLLINVYYNYLWNFLYLSLLDLYVTYFIMAENNKFFSEWK